MCYEVFVTQDRLELDASRFSCVRPFIHTFDHYMMLIQLPHHRTAIRSYPPGIFSFYPIQTHYKGIAQIPLTWIFLHSCCQPSYGAMVIFITYTYSTANSTQCCLICTVRVWMFGKWFLPRSLERFCHLIWRNAPCTTIRISYSPPRLFVLQ
jgi:hypothetical protein